MSIVMGGQKISSAVTALREEGISRVILDLSDCSIANSIGVSLLIEVMEALKEASGRLSFCCATPTIAKTLQIMGLLQDAAMHDSVDEALAALRG